MKRLAIAAVILLAAGCQSPDARLAKENADLKAQREDLILYVQSLQRERLWLQGQIDDLIRELERANGRRIF
jgi:hypothetical protein